jgi:hypothetical protein
LPFLGVRDLSDTSAQVINRIHCNRFVSSLFQVGGRRLDPSAS